MKLPVALRILKKKIIKTTVLKLMEIFLTFQQV